MKYISEDGMIFLNEDACRAHESIVSRAKLEEISDYCSLYDEDLDYVSLTARYKPYIINIHSNFEKVAAYIDKYSTWSAEGIESNDIYTFGLAIKEKLIECGLENTDAYQATNEICEIGSAVKDAYGVIRKMCRNAEEWGIDPDRMAVMGYSAGATLATVAAMQAVLNGEVLLKAQILHYPYLDAVHLPEEKKHYDCDMADEVMRSFTLLYSSGEERTSPYVSPVLAGDAELKGTAPALILPAGRDSLKEEGLLYAEHLTRCGVQVKVQVMEGMHHGYVEDAANPEAYAATTEDVKRTHDPSFRTRAEEAILMSESFLREKLEPEK